MINSETRSREQLSSMFNGEQATLGEEMRLFANSAAQQFGLDSLKFETAKSWGSNAEKKAGEIPKNFIIFLQSLLLNLSENSLGLISTLKEREAAKLLSVG